MELDPESLLARADVVIATKADEWVASIDLVACANESGIDSQTVGLIAAVARRAYLAGAKFVIQDMISKAGKCTSSA